MHISVAAFIECYISHHFAGQHAIINYSSHSPCKNESLLFRVWQLIYRLNKIYTDKLQFKRLLLLPRTMFYACIQIGKILYGEWISDT